MKFGLRRNFTSHFCLKLGSLLLQNVHISRKAKLHITLSLETRPLNFKIQVSRLSLFIETYKSFKGKFQGKSWNSRAASSLAPSFTRTEAHIKGKSTRMKKETTVENMWGSHVGRKYIYLVIYMPSSLLLELGVRCSLAIGRPRSGKKILYGVYGTISNAMAKA